MQVPAPFGYERANSVESAIALLEQHGGDARVLAGGHSLLPMMKLRLARPEVLIDINGLTELDYIRLDGEEIAIGALTRHVAVLDSALLAEHYRIFAEAERVIADPLVRNRGTVGGSLCQADPAEDLSAVLSALQARVLIRSSSSVRSVPLREFHRGPYETAVGDGELLVEVRVPLRPGSGSAYEKVERRSGDWAVAAAGAFVQLRDGVAVDVGIGLSAVGATHFTCAEAEDLLRGQPPTADVIARAAAVCRDRVEPSADQRGPVDYKRHLTEVLVTRALTRATQAAQGRLDSDRLDSDRLGTAQRDTDQRGAA